MSGGETPLERHLQTLPSVWNGETAAYYFTRFSRRTFYWDIAIWLPPRAKMLRPGPTTNRGGWGGTGSKAEYDVCFGICVCGLMWTMSWKFNRINTIVSPQPCGDSPTSQHLKSNCLFLFFFIQKNKYIYVQFQGFEIGGMCVCVFFSAELGDVVLSWWSTLIQPSRHETTGCGVKQTRGRLTMKHGPDVGWETNQIFFFNQNHMIIGHFWCSAQHRYLSWQKQRKHIFFVCT